MEEEKNSENLEAKAVSLFKNIDFPDFPLRPYSINFPFFSYAKAAVAVSITTKEV